MNVVTRRGRISPRVVDVPVDPEATGTFFALCGRNQSESRSWDLSVILWARHIMRVKNHGYADEEEETN
ncbi:hypothetical protein, partial [Burkholderia ubonensis]|uniref:hypothetical protein n=1 Tax=Burkholderia ubonensis TaxID=101571 RepID=UPI001E5E5F2C